MNLSDGSLSNLVLQMLGAEEAAFVLVSADGYISAQTPGARRLLRQKTLLPVGEVLSERAARAVQLVLDACGEAALDEEIDGRLYRLEIRPTGEGALLYFAPAEEQPAALPPSMFGQVTGALSHILAVLHLLPGASAEKQERLLDDARRSSLRIYRSLSHLQLLEYADDPERMLHIKEHDLAALCRRLCSQCAAVCHARSMAAGLACDVPERCILAYDEVLMTRAILGLLTNALRAPGVRRVTLSLRRAHGRVTLTVSDDGHGVPPEALDRLYHGWAFPMDEAGMLEQQAEGLLCGLGLPLVRKIAGWHGGTLLLDSAAESGAVFRLSFPDDLPPDGLSLGQVFAEDTLDIAELELSVL